MAVAGPDHAGAAVFPNLTKSGHLQYTRQINSRVTLIPEAENLHVMARVKVYSTGICPICDKTKQLLTKWAIPYEEVRLDLDRSALREFTEFTNGARTVPQITIDDKWIGSFMELTELHMEGELDALVES